MCARPNGGCSRARARTRDPVRGALALGSEGSTSSRQHVRAKRCAATPPRGHRPFYVGSRARGHSGGTLVGGRMTSAPSFHSLRTRCAAYGDDRRDTSLSGRLTCVQALAKLCRFASEPRARPNVWPEPRSGGPEGRPKGRLSVGDAESSPPALRARGAAGGGRRPRRLVDRSATIPAFG